MKRRSKIVLIAVLLALVLCAALTIKMFWGERYEILITESEIQDKIGEKFPLTKSYLIIFGVTYSDPVVVLESGDKNRIKVGMTAITEFSVNKNTITGNGLISGSVRYDSGMGSFFLNEIEVESFDLSGFPEKYKDKAEVLMSQALNEYYSKYPIYSLRDDSLKQMAAKLVLKSVTIKNKSMLIVLGIGI